jgi:hypothetical protein
LNSVLFVHRQLGDDQLCESMANAAGAGLSVDQREGLWFEVLEHGGNWFELLATFFTCA